MAGIRPTPRNVLTSTESTNRARLFAMVMAMVGQKNSRYFLAIS